MIPAEHKQEIIQSGINFMRSITEAYGSDEGMKLWDNIASVLDPDVKGQIFFAMLTGQYTNVINVTGHTIGADFVRMIKTIRNVDKRGLGLKEAKDLVDGAPKTVKEGVNKEEAESIKKKFTEAGATVEVK